jgi:hypothetical protein
MSFGVVQSAITSIRNNRNLISKRDKFKNTLSVENEKKVEFKGRKATPSELKLLRRKLQQENRRIRTKQMLALVAVMIVLLSVFFYYV